MESRRLTGSEGPEAVPEAEGPFVGLLLGMNLKAVTGLGLIRHVLMAHGLLDGGYAAVQMAFLRWLR